MWLEMPSTLHILTQISWRRTDLVWLIALPTKMDHPVAPRLKGKGFEPGESEDFFPPEAAVQAQIVTGKACHGTRQITEHCWMPEKGKSVEELEEEGRVRPEKSVQ